MNNTTFETSKRLKEAGFPQPKPEAGQYFYSSSNRLLWVQRLDKYGVFVRYHGSEGGTDWDYEMFKNLIFAPTATDILRQMPGFEMQFSEGLWYICNDETLESFVNSNPAEAAARAYLKLNEKDNIKKPDYWFDEL